LTNKTEGLKWGKSIAHVIIKELWILEITEGQLKAAFLRQRQCLPLDIKIQMTQRRIRHWYELHSGNVHVSFSGGQIAPCS